MRTAQFLKLGAVAVPGLGQPAEPRRPLPNRFRSEVGLTFSFPKSLDTLHGAAEFLVKRVAEMTDNRFQLQLFAAGEIVPGLQVLDATQAGTVEMAWTTGYYNWGKDTAFAFSTGVPFGLNARMLEAWYQQGGGLEMIQDLFKAYNCHVIKMGDTGGQMGGWFRNEIKSVDDLRASSSASAVCRRVVRSSE